MNTDDGSIIYETGATPEGEILIGGVWTLWEQEGFPLEMSHLLCVGHGWRVDWLEALADASCTDNGPALVKHIEAFLPADVMLHIKLGYMRLINAGMTCERILAEKQANGRVFGEFVRAVIAENPHVLE